MSSLTPFLPLVPGAIMLAFFVRYIWRIAMSTKWLVVQYGNTQVVGSYDSEDEARGLATRLAEQQAGRCYTIAKVVAKIESKANVVVQEA